MEGLRSTNEISQFEAVTELADMLLLGNEESLPNLPIKEIVHALIVLLQKEHNFELMLTAARCISNMLEALPRALPVVIDTVPYLLEKLKRIECIDVAEQSLMALEVMSKRNGKNIMLAGGIAATISHVDFFSVPSQRLAFQIAANCASHVSCSDFAQVRDSLADLTQRLLIEDKRCLESVCLLFCRLVENMRSHEEKLREIAGQNHALLKNIQQLLLVQPCAVGPSTFQALIRMLRALASQCSDLAVALIYMDFARTIKFLIVGSKEVDHAAIEIADRSPLHLQELVNLTGELMPQLPTDGIFEIDSVMLRSQSPSDDSQPTLWYWKNDLNQWLPFSNFDSRLIEMSFSTNEIEIDLQINGDIHKIDLQRMVQRNLSTGKERSIQRRTSVSKPKPTPVGNDKRLELMQTEPLLLEQVVQLLLPILVEIDGSSSGPALRYESLRVTLRMIYPSDVRVLKDILATLPLAGHIASALASARSKDLCVVASALQLTHLLLDKFPEMYNPLFKREGVAYEVEKLSKIKLESPVPSSSVAQVSHIDDHNNSAIVSGSTTQSSIKTRTSESVENSAFKQTVNAKSRNAGQITVSAAEAGPSSSNATRVIVSPNGGRHRRKASPESPISRKESRRKTAPSNFLHTLRLPSFRMPSTSASTGHSPLNGIPSNTSLSTLISSISPSIPSGHHYPSGSGSSSIAGGSSSAHTCMTRGRMSAFMSSAIGGSSSTVLMQSSSGHSSFMMQSSMSSASGLNHQQREMIRHFVRQEAEFLMQAYFSTPLSGVDGAAPSLLSRLIVVSTSLASNQDVGSSALTEFKTILLENDVSAFELNHSGVLTSLCTYLTSTSSGRHPPRKLRLKRFVAVFMSLTPDNLRPVDDPDSWSSFEILVAKLLASVAQQEQFQVKVTDVGGMLTGSSGGSLRGSQALRFFQTHQIRCNLKRHPSCKDLKDWRHGHGSIKVDPFTSISAIEKYLLDRGIGYVRAEESSGDEDNSDEEELPSEGSAYNINPQPGRIEILINDVKVPGHMSILQALRQFGQVNLGESTDQVTSSSTGIWVNTHTLHYRAAPPASSEGPAITGLVKPASAKSEKRERRSKINEKLWIDGEVPPSPCPLEPYLMNTLPVNITDPCMSSLVVLRCLYALNRFWWRLFDDEDIPPNTHAPILPNTAFHSSKLNAKVGRQLSDFLSVAMQQIPRWISDLIQAVPFIFTFPSRRNYLYCTAFGRDRALMHLVNQTDGGHNDGESGRLTPRLERRKVSVRRDDLLRQAEQTFHHLGTSRAMLEVGFEGEAGTGFGPTLEFYSAVSREIQKSSLRLWHGQVVALNQNDGPAANYTVAPAGLYPSVCPPQNAKQRDARWKKFEFIGRLLAQALIDARMLDIPFNPVFFKWLCGEDKMFGLSDLEVFDKNLYQSLRALILTDPNDFDSLEQYFTLPGDENFELIKGGKNRRVTSSNAVQFMKLVAHWRLVEGVKREMEAVRKGFETIIKIKDLSCFTPEEMEELFCGCSEETWKRTWNESALQSAIKPDHGYTHDSEQIRWLIQMLASYDNEQQRKFLQFVTGSPKLPVGGFRSLNPPLTVVKKSGSYGNGDDELPSAMTCYNYLKIPAYSTYEIFRERFDVALRFIYSFHLT
ncbi:unnamed protein product [Thelazia callipaeda]|uniref:E3 ubiquitin-protein ligase n=1 Tax=Thelazia callipaeda TaxID=103827 RepID=A0A0N5D733_THECL|nr:unnamed protein product [Thelazia callipaeda]